MTLTINDCSSDCSYVISDMRVYKWWSSYTPALKSWYFTRTWTIQSLYKKAGKWIHLSNISEIEKKGGIKLKWIIWLVLCADLVRSITSVLPPTLGDRSTIHSLNNYSLNICYELGYVPGVGNATVNRINIPYLHGAYIPAVETDYTESDFIMFLLCVVRK